MAGKKSAQPPRSPTTTKVFEAFVAALKTDPLIGEAVAARMEAALQPGQTINPTNLSDALFASEKPGAN
jgi:hypothetical protein